VPDGDRLPAYQDLFHKQPENLLPFRHVQRLRPLPQSCVEVSQRLDEPQILGLIAGSRFQRQQFSLNRLILLAEFWHAATELFQTHQTFLVGNQ
jgi:hypothetical protein